MFNMKCNNIDDVKRNINISTIVIFLIIFTSSFIGLYVMNKKFINERKSMDDSQIRLALNLYKSNLSEKINIIASSTIFIDYLRSGEATREKLYSQFNTQLLLLKSKSIIGISILNPEGKSIFDSGVSSKVSVTLKLCYLNQSLNSQLGDCEFSWKLYFSEKNLLSEIQSINGNIKACDHCSQYALFEGDGFSNFPIKSSSNYQIKLGIIDGNDHFFFSYLLLMTLTLVIFGTWSWYRLNEILNRYIAHPIRDLKDTLKSNHTLTPKDNIEEIQYLINEINTWKLKLNKIKADENAARLGEIAAQLAHDVRSPLAAIDMLVKKLHSVPENYRIIICNATQRISDIANNFLHQYKKPQQDMLEHESSLTNIYIPSLLESIVSEKRSQYIDHDTEINLVIDESGIDTFAFVNSADLKRVLSNLINNSIEAIGEKGLVHIFLSKNDTHLKIEIKDNGRGIPCDMIPKIIIGGISLGKKNGSGLGLSHAVKKINEWNGEFDIESELGKETIVKIMLPLSRTVPDWFKLSLTLPNNAIVCVLDDESHTHERWRDKLIQTKHHSFSLHHCLNQDQFKQFVSKNRALNAIYLVDYDLGMDTTSGLDIIEKFNLCHSATLVTNRYDDKDIQKKCMILGVKIIPKNLISHISIIHSQ